MRDPFRLERRARCLTQAVVHLDERVGNSKVVHLFVGNFNEPLALLIAEGKICPFEDPRRQADKNLEGDDLPREVGAAPIEGHLDLKFVGNQEISQSVFNGSVKKRLREGGCKNSNTDHIIHQLQGLFLLSFSGILPRQESLIKKG